MGGTLSWGRGDVIEVKESKNLRAPIKFNKIYFSRREGVGPSWWCHAHFQGAKLKLASRAFCWCIVCFCSINGSFRKLEKARGFLFLKFHNFYEIPEIIFFENFPPAFFNILKEPLLLQKLMIHQQKALNFSFNLAPWKWTWHYQEAVTPSRRKKHILLIFTAARRVFDFLTSMTSLEVNFKDTSTFRLPY